MANLKIYNTLNTEEYTIDRKRSAELTGYASIDMPWLKYYSNEDFEKELPKKTIYRYAKDANRSNPNLPLINWFGFKVSSKNFLQKVDEVANSFAALGVKKGDIVTICSPTFPETMYANYALNKIGAVANNIDPRTNAKRIQENLNSVGSDYLIMLDIAYPKIDTIIRDTKVKKVICNSYMDSVPTLAKPIFKQKLIKMLDQNGLKLPNIKFDNFYVSWREFLSFGKGVVAEETAYEPNMPAAMVSTGGTTGFPKSVVLTNDSALSIVEEYKATDLGLEKGQTLLNIMPEFIAYGWTFGVVMAPCLGIEGIIISQFNPSTFANDIIKYKPNHIVGVPTHLTALMRDERMKNVDLSKFLKSISAGGDSFAERDEREFNKFLHEHGYDKNVIVGFGLTERNSSVSTRLNKCNIIGSAGVPLVKNKIAIFKFPEEDGQVGTDEELKYGEYGEICITGPSKMLGYYNDPQKTREVEMLHKDGLIWTHTKDRGYMTEDGVLYHAGRMKRMIVRPDGHNVWPNEMENIILSHKDVEECCVVGVPSPDTTQGEYPWAVVVLNDGCTRSKKEIENELRELCALQLPERDVPYYYSFEGLLPLTGVGKVDFVEVEESVRNAKKRVREINN